MFFAPHFCLSPVGTDRSPEQPTAEVWTFFSISNTICVKRQVVAELQGFLFTGVEGTDLWILNFRSESLPSQQGKQ